MDKFAFYATSMVASFLVDWAVIIILSVVQGGCSFDGIQVCDICANPSLPFGSGHGLYGNFLSAGSYLLGCVASSLLSTFLYTLFFTYTILIPKNPSASLYAIAMCFLTLPFFVVIIFLITADVNLSLEQWRMKLPILFPLVIGYTVFRLVWNLIALIITPFYYDSCKNNSKRLLQ